jgi:hypothetical protein
MIKKILLGILLLSAGMQARAQVDAASSILVRPQGTESSTVGPNLDSSRYTVKPSGSAANRAVKSANAAEEAAAKVSEVKKRVEKKISAEKEKAVVAAPPPPSPPQPATEIVPQQEVNKNFTEELKAILLGGDEERMNQYLNQVHPQDPRQNLVNLSVATGYLYQGSSSESWYRRFHSSGPGVTVDADVWLSPMLGINLDYFTTLSADVLAEPTSNKRILVDHRFMNLGFQFRRYSSFSRKSPSVTWGIQYSEYQMIVPKAEDNRAILKSTGASVGVVATVPKTNTTAWTVGGDLYPKMKVSEGKTAIQVKSGNNPTAYGFRFVFGQIHTIDRSGQMFWRISHRVDKTVYAGDSSPVDPIGGAALTGVSVTSGTSMFEVGYTWGD